MSGGLMGELPPSTSCWQSRRARAFVPTLLAQRDLTLSAETVARTATAVAEVAHGAANMPADVEPLARLLLR